MKNIVVVYWSGTGNTELMAEAVSAGAKKEEVDVKVLSVARASKENILNADGIALGCPAMGAEVLEESEMEPFVQSLESIDLKGKPLVLFGSYDWGDGQWMRDWQVRMVGLNVKLIAEGLTVRNVPDEMGITECKELGAKLAEAVG